LGHDIGHTPFGHAGEQALNELLKDKGGFEHNRQGLRVVDELEEKYPGFRGLNLTFETREGIVRHTTPYDRPNLEGLEEFNIYISPTLEAQTIDVADQIAYNSHDLDDGLKSGFIKLKQIRNVAIWREIETEVKEEMTGLSDEARIYKIVRKSIAQQVIDVIHESEKRISEAGVNSVEDVRKVPTLIIFSPPMMSRQKELRDFLEENLYNHYKVVRIREKSRRYIEALFKAYIKDLRQLPPNFRARVKESSEEQVVCDYIAGMTDRFAQDEYTRLFMPYAKM
jgi:dGTPase